MGRHRNKLQELSSMVTEETKKIALDPASVLTPGIDYSALDSQLADIEKLGAPHPLSAGTTPVTNTHIQIGIPNTVAINIHKEEPIMAMARHQAVTSSLTGKMAMGPSFADLMDKAVPRTQRDMVEQMQFKKAEIKIEDSPIPVEDDFLNFLMSKDAKSFGWVVDRSFLANFYIDPETFEEDAKFIFWSKPVPVNLRRVSVTGFQRSEGNVRVTAPMIFFLHLVKEADKEVAFTKMINDPHYSKLRTELDTRGIHFIYHIDPRELWVSIQNKIAVRAS